jgi:hypothetical protein
MWLFVLSAPAGCSAWANAAPGASPSGGAVLVELFTSQGCSSCPAADALIADLPRLGFGRDRVVPLTFHVDYWDDLGWKDPFASPAFTTRQRRYTRAGVLLTPAGDHGISGAYTPQMVVGGTVHFSGARRDVAVAEIQRAAAMPAPVILLAEATSDGDHALVTARLLPAKTVGAAALGPAREAGQAVATASKDPALLTVALAMRSARTRVTRGENGGETLNEAAIVRVLSDPVPIDSGTDTPIRVSVAKPSDLAWKDVELAAFVQSATSLRVLAARAVTITPR